MQNEPFPMVSIIIPVYNGSDFLKEAIDSALSQTYKHIEILVVNDGSCDNGKTEAIAKEYGDKINYISKPNGGVASALNEGIRAMKGEYFSWLSHDDMYYSEKIEVQINCLKNLPVKDYILFSDYELINWKGRHLYSEKTEKYKTKNSLSAVFYQAINGCTMLIPKTCFNENMFNEDLKTTQDYELWVRLAKKYKFYHFNKIILKSRFHPNQGSRKITTHHEEANNTLINSIGGLADTEILSFNKTVSLFYIKMAILYKFMGYEKAYNHVLGKYKNTKKDTPIKKRLVLNFLELKLFLTPFIQFSSYTIRLLFINFNWYAYVYISFSTLIKRGKK